MDDSEFTQQCATWISAFVHEGLMHVFHKVLNNFWGRKQNQVTFIFYGWIHHCITVLLQLLSCGLSYEGAKQPQPVTSQKQREHGPNTATVCCRNNFQASGASLQAIAHLHSKSQLKFLPQLAASSHRASVPVLTLPQSAWTCRSKTGARSSLTGSWWILLINVNCANLLHRS